MGDKLIKCAKTVDFKKHEIPSSFTSYLISAEDHRSDYHFGIDQIGMVRAFYVWLTRNEAQGASTIEQQFVRAVTGDYERSLLRKLREQLLAIGLSSQKGKQEIATAYLAIAYYGYNIKGTCGVSRLLGERFSIATEDTIISIVARLKYPEPLTKLDGWKSKHQFRLVYIRNRYLKIFSKLNKRDVVTALLLES